MQSKVMTIKEAATKLDQLCEDAVNSQNIQLIQISTGQQVAIVSIADLKILYQMIAELGVAAGPKQAGVIAKKFQATLRNPEMVDEIVDKITREITG